MPMETLLNSTNSTKPTESRDSSSRELVESGGNSTETLLPESLENQGKVGIVESSRESGKSLGENNTEEIQEVEYAEEVKANV